MPADPIAVYLRAIEQDLRAGHATEGTHRPALKALVETIGGAGVRAINEPKHLESLAPDFRVTKRDATLGYIETKDVGAHLDAEQKTKQLQDYRSRFANLILTDYLEFRWYVDGHPRSVARLGVARTDGRITPDPPGPQSVTTLLRDFLTHAPEPIARPKDLAQRMARHAQTIRDETQAVYEREPENGPLHEQLRAFRDTLLPELKPDQFADMYAQTIAYGFFAARASEQFTPRTPHARLRRPKFSRESAAYLIPPTNPFLRNVFNQIAGPDLDERIAWLVDDLVALLADADMASVLEEFAKGAGREDPVLHFYETFLRQYDPKERKLRGVYYTPEPVVSYIVRSVDWLLRERFDKPLGLADPSVLVLDPALGTGTFLYFVIQTIYDRLKKSGQAGAWNQYVPECLLPRIFGFELLMAPYAMAHMKLGWLLGQLGYRFAPDQRLGVYLTNTLEMAERRSEVLFAKWITQEADAAAEVKRDKPIMVVLGNPPYAGHSANKGKWIRGLVEDYKRGCPELDRPGQAKWLQDDYVKFLRWGQWRIDRTGQGVLAFITNHGYLDNPTFRGMRQSLMEAFTDIYILDLHGNARKKEVCPDGSKDENVFDIQQGVAIGLFAKLVGPRRATFVRRGDLWGTRSAKYDELWATAVDGTGCQRVQPGPPLHMFVAQDEQRRTEYQRAWRIPDIMSANGPPAPGIVTTQDEFAISWSADEAVAKVKRLLASRSEDEARHLFRLCRQSQWSYERAKRELADGSWRAQVCPILYRPFDVRWTIYNPNVAVHRRERVMRHMLGGHNLGLITSRMTKGETFRHVQVTRNIVEVICMSPKTSNNGFVFPLYLYSHAGQRQQLMSQVGDETDPAGGLGSPVANLSPAFCAEVQQRVGLAFAMHGSGDLEGTFGPEDVFHYIYAILHSPTYRTRYAEFFKVDFPRIPLTSDKELFKALCEKGRELVPLHLMESPALDSLITALPVGGDNEVAKGHPRYAEPAAGRPGRVYINAKQYFEGVESEAWNFFIGGYQVCEKWLKDRRGRQLSWDDIQHYQKIVVALKETIRLMAEIDQVINSHGGWPIS